MTHEEMLNSYTGLLGLLTQEEKELKQVSFYLSLSRLAFFILLIALLIFLSSTSGLITALLGVIGAFIFLYIVKAHHNKERQRQIVTFKHDIIANEISAITNLSNVNYNGEKYIDQQHSYSSDLDVFGPFSLFGLINRCRTYNGIETLANYLSSKPLLVDLEARKEAIVELESDSTWRLDFLASLYEVSNGENINVAQIVTQILDADLSFAQHKWLKLYRTILPGIWIVVAISYFFLPIIAYIAAVVLGLINFRITMSYAEKVSIVQHRLSKAGADLKRYASSLSMIYNRSWTSTYISRASSDASHDNVKALNELKNIADLLDYRLHLIPSAILNIGFLWDSKICYKLSLWHENNEQSISDTFQLIGMLEALTSLASWNFNHPTHCYPKIDEEYFHLSGTDLRHPLLDVTSCVPNDFYIQPSQYVGIITGSNMSGKSTFLRTLGLNIVLGNSGVRVAGTSFSYCLCELITYMRIKDALEENVSTFKSELNRVVKMLELIDSDRPSLILADEMLRGTNSDDKLKGSKAIVQRIVAKKSYALVATHDIGLAHLGTSNDYITNHYFDIDYADGDLVFDYKIKEGICQSFNASFLLSQLGLEMN